MTVGALVVGGDYRGLGITRSLGRRGVPVWVAHGRDRIATHSRFCTRSIRLPDGDADTIASLVDLARRDGVDGWVLFPTSDESAALVSRHTDVLGEHYVLTTPSWSKYHRAADKRHAMAVAEAAGVGAPRTAFPHSEADLDRLDVPYPVVVKPAIRVELNELTYTKAWRADDLPTLRSHFRRAVQLLDPAEVMVQEIIPGDGRHQLSFAAVCRAGRPLVSVTACRTRQYPVDFGRASTAVVTISEPQVERAARRLLAELKADGLVEVEFKRDPRDGSVKLLDVNLRVWGWHSIGEGAGVDFAYAAYCLALGRPVAEGVGAVGVRWVRLSIDLPVAVRDIATGRLSPIAYGRSLRRPVVGPIAARDDPRPAVMEPLLLARTVVSRGARAVGNRHRADASGSTGGYCAGAVDMVDSAAPS